MKTARIIWTEDQPWIHVTPNTSRFVAADILPPGGPTFTAELDASKMLDAQGVFEEYSLHYRLPAYFGWNWPALSECLRDLSWIPARHYLTVIKNAEELLADEREGRSVLFKILNRAGQDWRNPIGREAAWGTGEVSFNTLLLCDAEFAESLHTEVSGRRASS